MGEENREERISSFGGKEETVLWQLNEADETFGMLEVDPVEMD